MRDQHAVWEAIAHSFDKNRNRTWTHVEAFAKRLAPGSRVLDLMGGNGRHLAGLLDAHATAVYLDWSRPAARIVAARYPAVHAVSGDATQLPLASHSMDGAIWVAGLHSLPTAQARRAALKELHRVLKPGGLAQITVWSRHAPRFAGVGDPSQCLDVVLPWKSDGHDAPRHYHLYTPQALGEAVTEAGFTIQATSEAAIVSKTPDNLVIEVQA